MPEPHNRKNTQERINFGKRVKRRRQEQELTQEKLAEIAEMDCSYLSSVERGERNISLEMILAIAKALQVSPKDLMPDSKP